MSIQTISDVVARMAAIQAGLPEADGVARFNHLYSEVTVAVRWKASEVTAAVRSAHSAATAVAASQAAASCRRARWPR